MTVRAVSCRVAAVVMLVFTSSPGAGYDLGTHALLSERAFAQSRNLEAYLNASGYNASAALDLGADNSLVQASRF